jgi:N-acyl-D-amino-acid deacylase
MPVQHDIVIRAGTLVDGSGEPAQEGDLAIDADRISAVGSVRRSGRLEIHARGLVVAPGFINMLSWANESLLEDGRSLSDLRQGVTLEVLGEGESMGPLTPVMRERMLAEQRDVRYDVSWNSLAEYLAVLEHRGVSTNVGSFLGASTVRIHELGHADRPPTVAELGRMRQLVRDAVVHGAFGVSSALIYAPGCYATTEELIALASESALAGGMYISHIRSEGARLLAGIEEFVTIAREARAPSEVYHLKALGDVGVAAFGEALEALERARAVGLRVTADMYPYAASMTGLDASMPPWVQEGGLSAWVTRLQDPEVRARVAYEMRNPTDDWESHLQLAGDAEKVMLVGFRTGAMKTHTGKSLARVAAEWGVTAEEAAVDLVVADLSRVEAVYFNQSEEVVRQLVARPWVSFGSDEASVAPEGIFLGSKLHPRAYGTFARVLGHFVRDQKAVRLEEAIRRMTLLPASNLGISDRGLLVPGYLADVVVFDPNEIRDHATYEEPHHYSTGVGHVFVNGVHTIRDGEHTGAKAGRAVGRGGATRGNRPGRR